MTERKRNPATVKSWNDSYYQQNAEKLKLRQREYRAANPEAVRAAQRRQRANMTPEQKAALKAQKRINGYMRKYGLTMSKYETMLEAQGGTCAICRDPKRTGSFGFLDVDHCHATGKVRGLLCVRCNQAIGSLGDTIEGLERAIAYLRLSG
jgi:hypothetical protein